MKEQIGAIVMSLIFCLFILFVISEIKKADKQVKTPITYIVYGDNDTIEILGVVAVNLKGNNVTFSSSGKGMIDVIHLQCSEQKTAIDISTETDPVFSKSILDSISPKDVRQSATMQYDERFFTEDKNGVIHLKKHVK